uniref:Uncharacterized protein n=1 Tax=Myotis myotis TaxID=51298 RepID=A0A7J7SRR9_MYOMY|nr:hypothetical protein mMyoMyo1_009333 [Myotis myotis]
MPSPLVLSPRKGIQGPHSSEELARTSEAVAIRPWVSRRPGCVHWPWQPSGLRLPPSAAPAGVPASARSPRPLPHSTGTSGYGFAESPVKYVPGGGRALCPASPGTARASEMVAIGKGQAEGKGREVTPCYRGLGEPDVLRRRQWAAGDVGGRVPWGRLQGPGLVYVAPAEQRPGHVTQATCCSFPPGPGSHPLPSPPRTLPSAARGLGWHGVRWGLRERRLP